MAKPSILAEVQAHFGNRDVSTKELLAFTKTIGRSWSSEFNSYKAARGQFNFGMVAAVSPIKKVKALPTPVAPTPDVQKVLESEGTATLNAGEQFESKHLIPQVDPNFVPYGYFKSVTKILKSNRFYPIYVTGPTGVGKSTAAIQSAASLGKRIARVIINHETTDDDLFGRKTMKNGNLKFEDGILTLAAELGFPIIIDEISAGDPKKLFGLYTILEGKRHYIKDANKFVTPNAGFTIIATDNTLGKGDDTGVYVGTNILNEAFLDRFAACYEQPYPSEAVETDMLTRKFASEGLQVEEHKLFIANVVKWANSIRKSYEEEAVDECISPRRLLFLAENIAIFGSQKEAIKSIVTRFDAITREKFISLFNMMSNRPDGAVDSSVAVDSNGNAVGVINTFATSGTSVTPVNP